MNSGRVALAALAAGIGMYFWTAVAHMQLPLATVGVSQIVHNEPALLESLHGALGNSAGLYIFPSLDSRPGDSSSDRADAMRNYDAKLQSNPSGILVYRPPGARGLTPGQLITEFLAEMIEAALAIYLLTFARIKTFGGRLAFVTAAGLLASLPTNISYWNWYSFPGSYTLSYIFITVVGFAIAGLIAAFILRGARDTANSLGLPR